MDDGTLEERLEMLLVMRWLDDDTPADGTVTLAVPAAATELGLEGDREGLLAVMGALGALEERGLVRVTWPSGPAGREARVELASGLRRDARRLFGRTSREP